MAGGAARAVECSQQAARRAPPQLSLACGIAPPQAEVSPSPSGLGSQSRAAAESASALDAVKV
jgi:hypothetical protein